MNHIKSFWSFILEKSDRKWNDKRKGPHPYNTGLSKEQRELKRKQMERQSKMANDDPKAYKEMAGDKEAKMRGSVKTSKHVKNYHRLYGDERSVNEKESTNNTSRIDDDKIEKALKKKAEATGVPITLLRIIMRRGMAAWKTGHRPGATVQQWGYARVNSFLTKQKGTWGGADSDVAKKVKDGGHDKKLKKG